MLIKQLESIATTYRDALWVRYQIENKIAELTKVIDSENLPINKSTGSIDFNLLKQTTEIIKATNQAITPPEKVVVKPQSTSALEQALQSTNAGK